MIVHETPLAKWSELNLVGADLAIAIGKAFAAALGGGTPSAQQVEEIKQGTNRVVRAIKAAEATR